ncbi:hypothetical protein OOU_Y34scaffold00669g11 [Pyricularia oryzae Y34]|uniref:Uncharacterized protein n=2 Tax=Pyricularia oryzae TaxID=318829 RepID=A0AA97NTF8_PYRO3|nr:hypothetical protein OOU_Y34scaffold00669g11 [Pyricularia oryzae Y34]
MCAQTRYDASRGKGIDAGEQALG